jgi:hypothetical protein
MRAHRGVPCCGYEWDDFELTESRADWLVQAVANGDRNDTMLDLAATNAR